MGEGRRAMGAVTRTKLRATRQSRRAQVSRSVASRRRTGRLGRGKCGRIASLLPLAVLVTFVSAVIHKAALAVAPPLYDSLSYYWKALSLARALGAGAWDTVMQAAPANRPPGLLPLYWVLGLVGDPFQYRAFYAMNMVLPVVLWTAACWISIPVRVARRTACWRRAALVAALALLPMFLQFEFDPEVQQGAYWGMQDTALASIAALALALLSRSLQQGSITLAALGFLLSAFSIMIKPSGVLVMLGCTGFWIIEGVLRWYWSESGEQRAQQRLLFTSGLVAAVAFQSTLFGIAYFSPYLSRQVIAQAVVLEMFGKSGPWSSILELCRAALGVAWGPLVVTSVLLAGAVLAIRRTRLVIVALCRLGCAVVILFGALYWWLRMAGPIPRYMYPFICMSLVLALPSLWFAWGLCVPRASARWLARGLAAIAVAQVALVATPFRVPAQVQWNLGVCLGTGQHSDCVEAGQFIVAQAASMPKPAVFMQADMYERLALVGSWLRLRNLEAARSFRIEEPFAWKSGNVLSRTQLLSAQFVVRDRSRERPMPQAGFSVSTFEAELEILNAWLPTLAGAEGVRQVQFGDIMILQVEDSAAFARSFDALVKSGGYVWRSEFLAHNYGDAGPVRR